MKIQTFLEKSYLSEMFLNTESLVVAGVGAVIIGVCAVERKLAKRGQDYEASQIGGVMSLVSTVGAIVGAIVIIVKASSFL
jgi:hypothetical protein